MVPFATSPIARVPKETWTLFLFLKQNRKRIAGLAAMIIVASALAYGSSIASGDSDPPLISQTTQSTMTGDRPSISWKEFAGFHSALHSEHKESARLFVTTMNNSGFADMAKEQENTTALPESGTGMLLSLGLFAAIYLRSRAPAIKRLH